MFKFIFYLNNMNNENKVLSNIEKFYDIDKKTKNKLHSKKSIKDNYAENNLQSKKKGLATVHTYINNPVTKNDNLIQASSNKQLTFKINNNVIIDNNNDNDNKKSNLNNNYETSKVKKPTNFNKKNLKVETNSIDKIESDNLTKNTENFFYNNKKLINDNEINYFIDKKSKNSLTHIYSNNNKNDLKLNKEIDNNNQNILKENRISFIADYNKLNIPQMHDNSKPMSSSRDIETIDSNEEQDIIEAKENLPDFNILEQDWDHKINNNCFMSNAELTNLYHSNKKDIELKNRMILNYIYEKVNPGIPRFTKIDAQKKKCQDIIIFSDSSAKEKAHYYYDKYPLLKIRKYIFNICKKISAICMFIVKNPIFDNIILLIILTNTLIILISDPNSNDSLQDKSDSYFLYLYTLECILKIFAFGFITSQDAYLKEAWNILDFVVVVFGWITLIIESVLGSTANVGLGALRSIRTLRPLKSIKSINGLRLLIETLLGSMAGLKDIIIVLFFFFLLLAVAGVQMWQGNLMLRCINVETGHPLSYTDYTTSCTDNTQCEVFNDEYNYYECLKAVKNPYEGTMTFDNTIEAIILVLVITTMEGWSEYYNYVSRTFVDSFYINKVIIFFYFHLILFVGGYYLLNLFLAVINNKFKEIEENNKIENKIIEKKLWDVLNTSKKNKKKDETPDEEKIVESLKSKYVFIEKDHSIIPVDYATLKDLFLLKTNSPEEMFYLKRQIKSEAKKILKEFKIEENKIKKMLVKNIPINKIDDKTNNKKKLAKKNKLQKNKNTSNKNIVNIINNKIHSNNIDQLDIAKSSNKLKKFINRNTFDIKLLNETIQKTLANFEQYVESKKKTKIDERFNNNNDSRDSYNSDAKNEKINFSMDDSSSLMSGSSNNSNNLLFDFPFKSNKNRRQYSSIINLTKFYKYNSMKSINTKKINNENKTVFDASESDLSYSDFNSEFYNNSIHNTNKNMNKVDNKMSYSKSNLFSNISPDNTNNKKEVLTILKSKVQKNTNEYGTNLVTIYKPNNTIANINKQLNKEFINKKDKHAEEKLKNKLKTLKDKVEDPKKNFLLNLKFTNLKASEEEIKKDFKKYDIELDNIDSLNVSMVEDENLIVNDSHEGIFNDVEINKNVNSSCYLGNTKFNNKAYNISNVSINNMNLKSNNFIIKNTDIEDEEFNISSAPINLLNIKIENKEGQIKNNNYINNNINKKEKPKDKFDSNKLFKYNSIISPDKLKSNNYKFNKRNSQISNIDNNNNNIVNNKKLKLFMPKINELTDLNIDNLTNIYALNYKNNINSFIRHKIKEDNFGIYIGRRQKNILKGERSDSINKNFYKFPFESYNEDNNENNNKIVLNKNKELDINAVYLNNLKNNYKSKQHLVKNFYQSYRKHLQYLYNLLNKDVAILDKFDVTEDASEILGIKEDKKLNKIINTKDPFVLFNPKNINIIRYQYVPYKFFELEQEDIVKLDHGLKNLNAKSLELIPPKTFYKIKKKHHHKKNGSNESITSMYSGNNTLALTKSNAFTTTSSVNSNKVIKTSQNIAGISRFTNNNVYDFNKFNYSNNYASDILDKVSYIKLNEHFMDEDKILDGNKISKHSLAKKNTANFHDVKEEVNRIKNYDTENNIKKNIEWSNQDVLNFDDDPNMYDNWNYEMVRLEQLNIILWSKKPFYGHLQKIRYMFFLLSFSQSFDLLIITVVIINAVFMALDGNLLLPEELERLSASKYYFNSIYITEFIVKIIGMGPVMYFSELFSYLDVTIIAFALLEMFTEGNSNIDLSQLAFLRVFRIFRVLRLLKVLRKIKSIRKILSGITRAISSVSYILLILLIFILIFQLLGMTLLSSDEGYRDILSAFYETFQLLTLENWNSNIIRLSKLSSITVIYLILWIFFGNFVLFNLFLSILLDSFNEEPYQGIIFPINYPESFKHYELMEEEFRLKNSRKKKKKKKLDDDIGSDYTDSEDEDNDTNSASLINASMSATSNNTSKFGSENDSTTLKKQRKKAKKIERLLKGNDCENALCFLKQQNRFRIKLLEITNDSRFDNFIMLIILLSTIRLIAETFVSSEAFLINLIFDILDAIFNTIFLTECIMKILSLGFWMDKGTYLKDGWNKLDFLIVIISVFDFNELISKYTITGVSANIGFLRVLRMLRILRPLRFISHNVQLKLIINSLFDSISAIINVFLIVLVVYFIFSIVGITLFNSLFHTCYIDQNVSYTFLEIVKNKNITLTDNTELYLNTVI